VGVEGEFLPWMELEVVLKLVPRGLAMVYLQQEVLGVMARILLRQE
jgi:hypothetical protein